MSTSKQAAVEGLPQTRVSWSIEPCDRHAAITIVALAGVVAAFVMAGLGLPPLDLHGPLHSFGIMDPFCGGTRSARYAAMGNLRMAWEYNPLGILAVLSAGTTVLRAIVGLMTGRWITPSMHWTRRGRVVALFVTVTLVAVLEVRQQMLAEMLLRR